MDSLCTSECKSSLADLSTLMDADCDDILTVDNQNWTFTDFMDHFQDKYSLICLEDETTGDFCLDLEARLVLLESSPVRNMLTR